MNRLLLYIMAVLLLSVQMTAHSQANAGSQNQAQRRCASIVIKQCISGCKRSYNSNCYQTCQENAKNRCRQAGE